MKKYNIEIYYRKSENGKSFIEYFNCRIDKDNLLSFNNYRFMYFKRKPNEGDFEFIKRNFKTFLIKSKYIFIDNIRIYQND